MFTCGAFFCTPFVSCWKKTILCVYLSNAFNCKVNTICMSLSTLLGRQQHRSTTWQKRMVCFYTEKVNKFSVSRWYSYITWRICCPKPRFRLNFRFYSITKKRPRINSSHPATKISKRIMDFSIPCTCLNKLFFFLNLYFLRGNF